MTKRASSALLATLLALTLAPPARAQTAADKETARVLFEEGKTRRDKGDWAGALESFRAADAIMKVPTTKLALARAYAALKKYVEAREAALQVALIPVAEKEPQAFTDARGAAAQLAVELVDHVSSLTIVLVGAPNTHETQVSVDGLEIPQAAITAPRRVNPGAHVVVASLRGGEVRREVELAEKQSQSLTLDVTELAKRPAPNAARTEPSRSPTPTQVTPTKTGPSPLVWVGLGVAVVGVGVGTTGGLISMSNKSDVDTQCRDSKCPPSAYDALDNAKSWATISTIGFAAAGVGAVVAGVGFFLGNGSSKKQGAGPYVEPVLTAGGAGLRGGF